MYLFVRRDDDSIDSYLMYYDVKLSKLIKWTDVNFLATQEENENNDINSRF